MTRVDVTIRCTHPNGKRVRVALFLPSTPDNQTPTWDDLRIRTEMTQGFGVFHHSENGDIKLGEPQHHQLSTGARRIDGGWRFQCRSCRRVRTATDDQLRQWYAGGGRVLDLHG